MIKGFRCQVAGKAKISRVGFDSAELVAGCADHTWRYTILLIRRAQRPPYFSDTLMFSLTPETHYKSVGYFFFA